MNKVYRIILLVLGLLVISFNSSYAENPKDEPVGIKWLTIQQAYTLWRQEPKKILVDVYTDWCGWCKVMDKNTFTNPTVANYVNKNFYPVRFNAEQREDVILGNQKWSFMAQGDGGVHQLAAVMLNGQMGYPTTVILDEKMQLIQPVPGYMDATAFLQLTTYFHGNFHRIESFDTYKTGTFEQMYGSSRPANVIVKQ
jgi:thioredoxin-related protein